MSTCQASGDVAPIAPAGLPVRRHATPTGDTWPVQPTESAVVVRTPEAEALVGRADLDVAAGLGVPAHVTVLAPFVAPNLLGDEMIGALAEAIGSVRSFDVTFARVAWFDRSVLWLAPEPAEPFQALTDAVWRRFPDCPPYRGEHQDVVPHLTVG